MAINTNNKQNEFDVISSFNFGYRNREDKTNLPPQTMVTGSQNVLTNVYGRISSRKGYTLDGVLTESTSSSPLSPGTMADDATVGTVAWLVPNNSKTSNNSYSIADFFYSVPNPGDPAPTQYTHYLKATNFGFSIPTGATINGILVEVEKKYNPDTTGYVADNAIRIVKGGTIGSTDKSNVSEWPLTDTYISYGASDNLWGETWTAEDINLTTFGFVLSCYATNSNAYSNSPSAQVDHIRITVYYTTTTTPAQAPILASYDWEMHIGYTTNSATDTGSTTQHLRAGHLTSAGNDGKLQYRYEASDGTVTWKDLITGLSSTDFNFCDYWDVNKLQSRLLMVNGSPCVTEWSGGITTFSTATAAGITKQGTETWAEVGFYPTGVHTVVIAGLKYGATGGWDTTTLTGVSPSPLTTPATAGVVIHQKPEGTNLSAMTGIGTVFAVGLIANLKNQVYLGSFTNNSVFVSKVNNYKNYSYTTPTRVVGEGAILTLDGAPKALIPREDQMNISAGKDQWYKTQFTLSADLTKEELTILRLKTTSEQATQSQALTSKFKNNVVFVSNEPILESLGWVDNVFGEPQLTDVSYPIVNDFNTIDFTDGEVRYHKNYIYVSAPKESKVFVYNMTNPTNKYWEAPQVLPVGRFSVIDGDLYGHSYQSSESYKLFDGYNDNGNFIQSNAVLAFNSHGIRHASKGFNQYFVEGYISTNTTLQLGLQYDIDGCATITAFNILGSDAQIVCLGSDDNLLGKFNLGKVPLGANIATATTTPSKFRVIKTFPKVPYYEYQVSFNSVGYDQNWEILAFGPAWSRTFEGNNAITE